MRGVCAIIGWPVRESLSPAMHNAAYRAAGLDWVYLQHAVPPTQPARALHWIRLTDAVGANVTTPHKRTVIPFLDGLAGDAATVDAVNTIARESDALIGHNTDGAGFVRFLTADAGFDPSGRTALLVGAGGAARGVALALARAGASVRVCARRRDQAEDLARDLAGVEAGRWEDPGAAELVVQATSARAGLPLDRLELGAGVLAVDLIYPLPPTPFLQAARAAGAAAYDGLGMLLHQAAFSFELWTGRPAPVEAMRAAAEAARAPQAPKPG